MASDVYVVRAYLPLWWHLLLKAAVGVALVELALLPDCEPLTFGLIHWLVDRAPMRVR